VRDRKLTRKDTLLVETASGIIELKITQDGWVTVNMGEPELEPAAIPFQAGERSLSYEVDVLGQKVLLAAVSMGNPHAVLLVDDVATAPVATLGPALENHPRFPERVNVGFMQVVNRGHIKLRVFERGSGETLACGTGACAAVVAGILQGRLDARVKVQLPGGELNIRWAGKGQPVFMTGPSAKVFDGFVRIQDVQET
jgi:diaminopimelate epimerase